MAASHGPAHMVIPYTIPKGLTAFPRPVLCSGRSVGCSLRAACCNVTRRNALRFLREAIPWTKKRVLN